MTNLTLDEIKLIDSIRNLKPYEKIVIKLDEKNPKQVIYIYTKQVKESYEL